jgi:hypothetical protein
MKTGLAKGALLISLSIVGFSFSGCKTPPYCPDGLACGGPLFENAGDSWKQDGLKDKEWVVSADRACSDQLQVPPVPLSLVRQPPVQATDRPPDKVTADWCSNIVFKQNGELAQFIVWAPPIPVQVGQLKISVDRNDDESVGTYQMQITYLETRTLEFSETCLTSQGLRLTCPQLGRQLGKFLAAEANIYNSRCYDPPDPSKGGCLCNYELSFIGGPNGRWYSAPGSTTITFFDDLFAPPATADYCMTAEGDGTAVMELTGHDTTPLFNAKSLRTLRFHPPTCNDGIRNAGEDGVDCGGICAAPCGTCSDGKAGPGEEGVDCGGQCLGTLCDCGGHICDPKVRADVEFPRDQKKSTCKNGVKDFWEEGVDCGSFCPDLCP